MDFSREFNPEDPIAYFLTWTTYGTWLPGDERGWHSTESRDPEQPVRGYVIHSQYLMKETEFRLTPELRKTIHTCILDHCAFRTWTVHALNVRSNHIHIVLTAKRFRPEKIRDQLKSWCTRTLSAVGVNRNRFWTQGGSCRWINQEDDLWAAISYVRDSQDLKDPFSF